MDTASRSRPRARKLAVLAVTAALGTGTFLVASAASSSVEDGAGAVHGTVLEADGSPVDHGYVFLSRFHHEKWEGYGGMWIDDGEYSDPGLPNGRYKLWYESYSSDEEYLPEYSGDQRDLESATELVIEDADKTIEPVRFDLALGADPAAVSRPRIGGVPVVGKRLTATTGAWNFRGLADYSYRWLRDGRQVGTAKVHPVTSADVGHRLRVEVTAKISGRTGTSTSAATRTVRYPSSARLTATSPRARTARLAVTVRVPGVANPTGTVRITEGSRVRANRVVLRQGKAVVTLRASRGRHTYAATYRGTSRIAPSSSARVRVSVR